MTFFARDRRAAKVFLNRFLVSSSSISSAAVCGIPVALVVDVPLRMKDEEEVRGGVSCSGVGVAVVVVVDVRRRSVVAWAWTTEERVGGGKVEEVGFGDGVVKRGGAE